MIIIIVAVLSSVSNMNYLETQMIENPKIFTNPSTSSDLTCHSISESFGNSISDLSCSVSRLSCHSSLLFSSRFVLLVEGSANPHQSQYHFHFPYHSFPQHDVFDYIFEIFLLLRNFKLSWMITVRAIPKQLSIYLNSTSIMLRENIFTMMETTIDLKMIKTNIYECHWYWKRYQFFQQWRITKCWWYHHNGLRVIIRRNEPIERTTWFLFHQHHSINSETTFHCFLFAFSVAFLHFILQQQTWNSFHPFFLESS